jgi:hypothetical protein
MMAKINLLRMAFAANVCEPAPDNMTPGVLSAIRAAIAETA